jgi:hypothetical protein
VDPGAHREKTIGGGFSVVPVFLAVSARIVFHRSPRVDMLSAMPRLSPALSDDDYLDLAREAATAAGVHADRFVALSNVGAVLAHSAARELAPRGPKAGVNLVAAGVLTAQTSPTGKRRVVSLVDLGRLIARAVTDAPGA